MHPDIFKIARHWLVAGLERGRDFVVLQQDIDWLTSLDQAAFERLALTYRTSKPLPLSFVNIPKNHGQARQAAIIPVRDRLIVTALLAEQYAGMRENVMACRTPGIDFQNMLPADPMDVSWINSYKDEYARFREQTEKYEDAGYIVLHTDVENFSGLADVEYLLKEMGQCGWPQDRLDALGRYLNDWQTQGMNGLPQGTLMCDILSKYAWNHTDEFMAGRIDFHYYRYNDDIRIASKVEALGEFAASYLEDCLTHSGLSLNIAKTHTNRGRKKEQPFRLGDYYDLSGGEGMIAKEALERVYREHLTPGKDPHQTLFNYTVNRLRKAGSAVAQDDLPDLVCAHGGSLSLLVRYALATGARNVGDMHDALPETGARHYFKYLALREMSTGRQISSEQVRLVRAWSKEECPAYVMAKMGEFIQAYEGQRAVVRSISETPAVEPPASLDLRLA